jgi:hypothetical protein
MDMFRIIIPLCLLCLPTFDVGMGQRSTCSSL